MLNHLKPITLATETEADDIDNDYIENEFIDVKDTSDIIKVKKVDPLDDSPFIKMCNDFENRLKKDFQERREELRKIKGMFIKEMKSATKQKQPRPINRSGFNKLERVPAKIANFIEVGSDDEMSRTQVTKLVYQEFNNRQLYYKDDKRVLRTDADVKHMFNISDEINDKINRSNNPKDKSGLNFYNLQSYIAECYKLAN